MCLPTYNELENLERMIRALAIERTTHGLDRMTVLVIDDGSPDGTGAVADRLAAELEWVQVLHRTAKEGLGRAYLAGFQVALDAGAELIMEMDCDFSHNPRDVHRLIAASTQADLVLGSRGVTGGGVTGWPLSRRIISRGGSFYARTILGLRVRDLTGGFKLFHRRVLEAIDFDRVEAAGYTFQIELTYRARQLGFSVLEVPIIFIDREFGESKMTGSIVTEAMVKVWQLKLRRDHGAQR
ncbi:MAG: polyprenol monophosphomannose synthase [Thermoleophilia bacterium]|nr:polyprenol monophosphomannose synthase [Thermoleophilia bacterium]